MEKSLRNRKKPFSNKKKKEQLKEKRIQKKSQEEQEEEKKKAGNSPSKIDSTLSEIFTTIKNSKNLVLKNSPEKIKINKLNNQPVQNPSQKYNPNRYKLHFEYESKEEIQERKKQSQIPYKILEESSLRISLEDIYPSNSLIDIPKRPAWNYSTSKEELENHEEEFFQSWLEKIYRGKDVKSLSYFEHNLETWRQLWRVLEFSDEILLIGDIRHPVLHFPPSLYFYVVEELKKPLSFVLNKVDLVPLDLAKMWKKYFEEKFPKLEVILFSIHPPGKSRKLASQDKTIEKAKRGKRLDLKAALGVEDVFSACQKNISQIHFSESQEKILDLQKIQINRQSNSDSVQASSDSSFIQDSLFPSSTLLHYQNVIDSRKGKKNQSSTNQPNVSKDYISIGVVGHPNVGKSAIINGLVGRKVVSSSRTPGHTKHFQTIFLNKQVRLVDCPGMVFPSYVDRQLQVLSGIFPIAQVKEPYTAIGYLAQRVPLPEILQLCKPEESGPSTEFSAHFGGWSAWNICEAYAIKRKFYTAKAARPDVYRAANLILRLAVDGRIVMAFFPPGYVPSVESGPSFRPLEEASDDEESSRAESEASADSDGLMCERQQNGFRYLEVD